MDSQVKHVAIAIGRAGLLLRFPTREGFHDAIWDQAAGSLLIDEAGGRVTDLKGRSLDFSAGRRLLKNDGVVASNGRLHDAVMLGLRQSLRLAATPVSRVPPTVESE
jgi:3'(2'), 5'-bisphosphate nucleotidase